MASAPDPRKIAAQQRAEDAKNLRYILGVDDTEYVFRLGDITAQDVSDLRKEGLSVSEALDGLHGVAAFDRFAALVWLARRQAGESRLKLATVESELRFDQAITTRDENEPEPVEEFPDPPP